MTQVHAIHIEAGEDLIDGEVQKFLHRLMLLFTEVGCVVRNTFAEDLAEHLKLDWVAQLLVFVLKGEALLLGSFNVDGLKVEILLVRNAVGSVILGLLIDLLKGIGAIEISGFVS